ncbi:Uncharacterised protein [Mycolicibacterium vanbaalenii]|uniref:DUF5642 domain-containing protein n=1 Tax=Mycolicibacterium vanbaalenii TaxID=110539 RepID=A0A5S9NIF1_MYCVN|nr:hypothetical protein [Mycolicibacterium vanbaalenii]CAA0089793.1 Uncharacterised protein [Mycolicibacterium vanbaalenii]CAA0133820.1 Uncharacterised protein [Mycolicibacterium vanbaalenii]
MTGHRVARVAVVTLVAAVLAGCSQAITGTAVWPGEKLERAVLTEADFPAGVRYQRILKDRGEEDGAGAPPPMLSSPQGCTDGLTRNIAETAERGAGSAAEYMVAYDGARVIMTVLTWSLNLEQLAATAERCARYDTFFEPSDPGIPVTTTRLQTPRPDALVYQQTMSLNGLESSVYFSFENVGTMAVFGLALPTPDPGIAVKGTLPQTFLEITDRQAERAQAV